MFFLYAAFLSDSPPRDLSGGQPPSRPGFANRLILKSGCSWLTSMWTGRGKMMLSPTAWEEDKERRSTHADAPCVTCSSCSWHETQRGGCARRRPWGRAELGLGSDLDPRGLASSGAAQGRAQPRAPSMPPVQASLLVSTPFISSDFKLAGVLVVTNQCKTVPWSSTATLLEQKAENDTQTHLTPKIIPGTLQCPIL